MHAQIQKPSAAASLEESPGLNCLGMGATSRPLVKPDALANGEASNNAIEVVRNWWRCMDLELIGEAQRGARSPLSDFFILIIFGGVNRHAAGGRPSSSSKDFSSMVRYKEAIRWIGLDQVSPERYALLARTPQLLNSS